jgi:pantoate--beta-alanine ligase
MDIIRDTNSLENYLNQVKKNNLNIGFVPTMGALHNGHLSLITKSTYENEVTLVSIFVNPTQFNEASDFANYPRTENSDLELIRTSGATLVFIPETKDMYSEERELLQIDLEGLDEFMEGAHRPGHFNGVVTIVDKFFSLINPNKAYFGQKDFQQLAIIKLLAKKRHPGIEIVSCPIIREASGLALSSRNQLLSESEKTIAAHISSILVELSKHWKQIPIGDLKKNAIEAFTKLPMDLEYLEIVDDLTLRPILSYSNKIAVACVAVRLGKVRLIDNIRLLG